MKRRKISEMEDLGINVDVIVRNSAKQASTFGLKNHGRDYFEASKDKSAKSKRLYKKELAFFSR